MINCFNKIRIKDKKIIHILIFSSLGVGWGVGLYRPEKN